MSTNILVAEDEEALRIALSDRLKSEGYAVESAADGEEAYQRALAGDLDLIVLDLKLPRKNGFDVCRDIRKSGSFVPIIMLTARHELVDKVLGLKIGADDYVTKPFEMLELLARIEARLRVAPRPPEESSVIEFGPIRVDLQGTVVKKDGQLISLSAKEFQLLRYFVKHPGVTLSRDVLLKEVWTYHTDTFTRTVDMHVASLRQKLEKNHQKPSHIVTVLGLGYKFCP